MMYVVCVCMCVSRINISDPNFACRVCAIEKQYFSSIKIIVKLMILGCLSECKLETKISKAYIPDLSHATNVHMTYVIQK